MNATARSDAVLISRGWLPHLIVALGVIAWGGCGDGAPYCSTSGRTAEGQYHCLHPDAPERGFNLIVPPGDGPFPVVLHLHDAGGDRDTVDRPTCGFGDPAAYNCMRMVGMLESFITVEPTGSGGEAERAFNGGGGADGFACVGGAACTDDVDEAAYFRTLLDEVEAAAPVDATRVYAVGLGAGGAMAHRLACEQSARIAAIASFGAGNQWSATNACQPEEPVGVALFHGTADPVWPFDEEAAPGVDAVVSSTSTLYGDADAGIDGWLARNGCDDSTGAVESLEDRDDDGLNSTRTTFECPAGADVEHFITEGGGHGFPAGWTGANPAGGPLTGDFSGSESAWRFLRRFSR